MRRIVAILALLLAGLAGIVVFALNSERPSMAIESVAIPNAAVVDGTVLVGGQPSQANLDQAADAGYTTVINLRPEGEFTEWNEAAEAESRGLRYVSIPVAGASGLTLENAKLLRAELDRSASEPVLLHCASGNRVGALLALSAFHFDSASPEQALAIGLKGGLTSLEPRVAEYLANQAQR